MQNKSTNGADAKRDCGYSVLTLGSIHKSTFYYKMTVLKALLESATWRMHVYANNSSV